MIGLMKKISGFISASVTYLLLAQPASAQILDICPLKGKEAHPQFNPLCALSTGDFGALVGNVITLLFIIAVVIAILFLIYGGIKWILSGGDKSAVEAARNHIIAAIVGLVIAFLAYFILSFVIQFFLPGFNISRIELPTLRP